MHAYFLDTSALVKRYRAEQGTDRIDALFAEPGSLVVISRLGLVEAVSAFAMKVRTRELSLDDFLIVRRRLAADIAHRTISLVRLLVGHYRDAERLLEQYAIAQRLRSLDAIQLSVALSPKSAGRIDRFVSADQLLVGLAAQEGLPAFDPGASPSP
jgi:predicted nucleic acid-binding protein